jgi:hypothetical protein
MVRKVLILLLSATLAVSLVLFLPGCGQGDEGRAKEYIDKGDSYMEELNKQGKKLEEAISDFFATLIGPNPESVSDEGGPLDKYWSALYVGIWMAQNADAEYKPVLEMKGVEELKKVAGMMSKISEKTLALFEYIKVWFQKALNVVTTRNVTKITAYLTGAGGEFVNGQKQIQLMREQIDTLVKEATDYREGKKL